MAYSLYMQKRVFITGAAGFIGFHLAKFLAKRGDKVIGYDNFNDYYDPALKRSREAELKKAGIEVIEGDICDYQHLQQATLQHQTSHLVHLAAQAGVRYSITNPHAYIKANLEGFLNILEICRCTPSVPLTYASSSSVYGQNEQIPFSVEDRTDNQTSLYGVTKKTNELMAETYRHLYGIRSTGLRFFTVYGPWGRPDMAYYTFTKAIIEGRTIDIYNHGKMLRDFTYIDDIVEGTTAAMDLEGSEAVFNLGNNQPVEIIKFIEIIEQAVGKKAKKNFLPMQQGDMVATYADIDKSIEKLNFSPKIPIDVGIPRFVDWYRKSYV